MGSGFWIELPRCKPGKGNLWQVLKKLRSCFVNVLHTFWTMALEHSVAAWPRAYSRLVCPSALVTRSYLSILSKFVLWEIAQRHQSFKTLAVMPTAFQRLHCCYWQLEAICMCTRQLRGFWVNFCFHAQQMSGRTKISRIGACTVRLQKRQWIHCAP